MNTISQQQRFTILKLWSAVCKDRGWKSSDRALRLATIGGLISRELKSLDEVERLDECTKVMNELKAMLGTSLQAGLEASNPGLNRKRNWKWLIANEALPCLALYPLDQPMGDVGAFAYLVEVMTGKSRYRKTDRPESEPSLEDFDERTCQQIYWTLNARLNVKRKAAGHTGHQMCVAAQIDCKCAPCKRARAKVEAGPVIPPLPVETDKAGETATHLKEEGNESPF